MASSLSDNDNDHQGLLDQRDQEVLLAAAAAGGGSPRRRWSPRSEGKSPLKRWSPSRWSPPTFSPSKLSPSSMNSGGSPFHRRKQTNYSGLDGVDSSFDKEDQENSVPLADKSVDHTGSPAVSAEFASLYAASPAASQKYQLSKKELQLPSPSPKARFSMTTLRQRGLQSQPLSPPKRKSQNPASPSIGGEANKDPTSPIFRFRLQTSPLGTEAVLPGTSSVAGIEEDRNEDDDFDILVKERQGSVRENTNGNNTATPKERTRFSDTNLPSPPGIQSARHLHDLCASISTLDDLLRAQTFLKGHYSYASKVDMQGRTPLHIFSCNKILATAIGVPNEFDVETREFLRINMQLTHDPESNQLEKHVLRFLVGDLLPAHPGAMMLYDDQSTIPFEKPLAEWVKESHQRGVSNGSAGTDNTTGFSYSGAMSNVWESTVKMAGRTSQILSSGIGGQAATSPTTREASGMERGDSQSAIFSPDTNRREQLTGTHNTPGNKPDDTIRDGAFPGFVKLTPQARFTLTMLSAALDQLERYQSPELLRRSQARPDANSENFMKAHKGLLEFQRQYGSVNIVLTVVDQMASIPDLLVTILLIDSESDREYALSTTVVRRIMLCKKSVGPWLTKLLQSRDSNLAQRAVDYLKRVSNELGKQKLSSSDGISSNQQPDPELDHPVVQEVSRLQDFVPSLLALNERGIEDTSTTLIVKRVLSRMISRPFAVTVILCDMFFLAMLIIGFRFAVNRLIGGAPLDQVLQWIYIANTGIFYFIIREIGKTVSLFLISTRARSYFLSFWNLIDALAVMLALASTIVMRSHFTILESGLEDTTFLRGLLAVTTGFLWLRVLSLLKAINVQLATFVLAILQITKDILWFAVILATMVVSFAQMFFTILAPPSCGTAEGGNEMMCKPTEYLLLAYTILLGDFGAFEREQFTTGFSVVLVVLYSFLVTVVLLNVLIAVASDSYEKCLLRSQHLFGRARVMLIAELVGFQNLLQTTAPQVNPGTKQELYSSWRSPGRLIRHWSRASILFFSLSVLVIVAWTISELLGYAKGEQHANIAFSLASVIVNVGLFAIIMVFLAAASANRNQSPSGKDPNDGPLLGAMLHLLGVSRNPDHCNKDDDQWNGRVNYLEREMRSIAEDQRILAGQQVKTMENLVNQTELRLKAELEAMEDNFVTLREALLHEVKGTKRTNQYVTIAVQELKNLMSTAASTAYEGTRVPSEVNVGRANAFNTERRDG
jgi:hypothetical protein